MFLQIGLGLLAHNEEGTTEVKSPISIIIHQLEPTSQVNPAIEVSIGASKSNCSPYLSLRDSISLPNKFIKVLKGRKIQAENC